MALSSQQLAHMVDTMRLAGKLGGGGGGGDWAVGTACLRSYDRVRGSCLAVFLACLILRAPGGRGGGGGEMGLNDHTERVVTGSLVQVSFLRKIIDVASGPKSMQLRVFTVTRSKLNILAGSSTNKAQGGESWRAIVAVEWLSVWMLRV